MSKLLEDRIAALAAENHRLTQQNESLKGDFETVRAYFREKPATLEVLAALKRAQDDVLRDRQRTVNLLNAIGGAAPAPATTDCGVNPLMVVCNYANGGDCFYPSNVNGCQYGRDGKQAVVMECRGVSAYAV